jgi:S-adenosylmethionine:tRNA ribosyltransferase-isomerase
MDVNLFDFELPQESIALRPVEPRDSARLLVVAPGDIEDRRIGDLPSHLRAGDVLVFNDTKVIPAQLTGHRPAREHGGGQGAQITVNLHKLLNDHCWQAFVKPAKRLRQGDVIHFAQELSCECTCDPQEGEVTLAFSLSGSALMDKLNEVGNPPLPPYIASQRRVDDRDLKDYQTIYADREGSVAAPTAGLHFTEGLVSRLTEMGVQIEKVTLHVGAGTFLPVKTEDTASHVMHSEWGEISPDCAARLNSAKAEGRRIVATGTTSLRLLESAADESGHIENFDDETDIFITPGYKFRFVDVLMTNFHLPKSTLFMLVSAFSGRETMLRAYAHAIETGYRFYSYGDACLLSLCEDAP